MPDLEAILIPNLDEFNPILLIDNKSGKELNITHVSIMVKALVSEDLKNPIPTNAIEHSLDIAPFTLPARSNVPHEIKEKFLKFDKVFPKNTQFSFVIHYKESNHPYTSKLYDFLSAH